MPHPNGALGSRPPEVPITPSAGGGAAGGCAGGVEDPHQAADTKAHLRAVRPERIQPAFGMAVMWLSGSGAGGGQIRSQGSVLVYSAARESHDILIHSSCVETEQPERRHRGSPDGVPTTPETRRQEDRGSGGCPRALAARPLAGADRLLDVS